MFNKKKKSADKAAKIGRPTKYDSSMCAKVLQIMMDGGSKTQVAAELGISKDTLYEWAKVNPEFSDAIKKGEALSQSWFEQKANLIFQQPAGKNNAAVLIFLMKNRFQDYRDKQPTSGDGQGTLNQLSEVIQQSLPEP